MHQYRRIGEWLLEHGILDEEQLKAATQAQKGRRARFGELLVEMGFCKERDIVKCLSEQFDVPMVKIADIAPQRRALNIISGSFALNHSVLPVRFFEGALECVISDPLDIEVTDTVREKAEVPLKLFIAEPGQLKAAIRKAYRLPSYEKPKKATKGKMKIDAQSDRRALIDAVDSTRRIS